MAKDIAYYDPKMEPNPLTQDIDGMWITKGKPYTVVRVWQTDSERPKLAEEPPNVRGYAAFMARQLFDFEPLEERSTRKKRSSKSRI